MCQIRVRFVRRIHRNSSEKGKIVCDDGNDSQPVGRSCAGGPVEKLRSGVPFARGALHCSRIIPNFSAAVDYDQQSRPPTAARAFSIATLADFHVIGPQRVQCDPIFS